MGQLDLDCFNESLDDMCVDVNTDALLELLPENESWFDSTMLAIAEVEELLSPGFAQAIQNMPVQQVGGSDPEHQSDSDETIVYDYVEPSVSVSAGPTTEQPSIDINRQSPQPIAGPSTATDLTSDSSTSVTRPVVEWHEVPNQRTEGFSRRFQRTSLGFVFTFVHNMGLFPNLLSIANDIDKFYYNFIRENTRDFDPEDWISVDILHENLTTPLFIPHFKLKDFSEESSQRLLNTIFEVAQSNNAFLMNGRLRLKLNRVRAIAGSGNNVPQTIESANRLKRSVIIINNQTLGYESDKGCAFHAIAMCEANAEKIAAQKLSPADDPDGQIRRRADRKFDQTRLDSGNIRRTRAEQIARVCNRTLNEEVNLNDFDHIQAMLQEQIIVLDSVDKTNILFRGDTRKGDLNGQYYLLYRGNEVEGENHFDAIVKPKAFFGYSYFCTHCIKPFSNFTKHICDKCCERCQAFPPCDKNNNLIPCGKCHFKFYGQQCKDKHESGDNSVCDNVKFCSNCECTFSKGPHNCIFRDCKFCNETYTIGKHYCHIRSLKMNSLVSQDNENRIIIAYDIECAQNYIREDTFYHVPDLLIARIVCSVCWDHPNLDRYEDKQQMCSVCGVGKRVFDGNDCIRKFGDFIYKEMAKRAKSINSKLYIFAHNAKGYDNHFILNNLFLQGFTNNEITMCGNKVLKIETGNCCYLDTLLIFQQALATLPKAFGFEDKVIKGHFPHNFHSSSNLDYNGELPAREHFGVKYMKPKQLKDFDSWYSEQQQVFSANPDLTYNLKDELIKYCSNDVDILLYCIQSFRTDYRQVTGLDPISRKFTLASMGMELYRAKVLPDQLMGITPIMGYAPRRNASLESRLWLDFKQYASRMASRESHLNRTINIEREVQIGSKFADGYDKISGTAYEFNGCFWHGHDCYLNKKYAPVQNSDSSASSTILRSLLQPSTSRKRPSDSSDQCPTAPKTVRLDRDTPIVKLNNRSMNQARSDTAKKLRILSNLATKVEVIWECDWIELKKNPLVSAYVTKRRAELKKLEEVGGVDVREAFFGGRTNNIRFWCNANDQPDTEILYYDFRSLYPTVLKYREFPQGHPIVISEDISTDMSKYFGFANCEVLPPDQLYIPVLPYRNKKGKLLFPLCRTCADRQKHQNCDCAVYQRAITGTWTTIELEEAVKQGYKILNVYEVYHYEQKSKDFFAKYIDIWLKIKQESDGWPAWVETEEDKDLYISQFEEKEGIKLDKDRIEKNPGLRFIAKLFLNTLWGKLAQRPNMKLTKVCNTYDDYMSIVKDIEKVIMGELMVNDDTLLLSYKHKSDETTRVGHTSLAIAAFVTSWGRLMLLNVINQIESRQILYFDTDSVIFSYMKYDDDGCEVLKPDTGDYLGDLADEIVKDYGVGAKCKTFVSLAPKVYALEIYKAGETTPCVPIKLKGISLYDTTLSQVTFRSMYELAKDFCEKEGNYETANKMFLPQMNIRATNLQTVETTYTDKAFRATSDKRRIVGTNYTLPFGWKDNTSVVTTTIVRAD